MLIPLKLYSKYIFYKTFVGFAACISILVSLIWFSRAISFVNYITENGVAIKDFLYLFILILPWLLIFIIPISLLGAILIVYNRLITSNEMAILRNAGLKKSTISLPAIYLALICTLICFSLSFYFMPYANKELRLSRNNLRNNYSNLSINPQTFESMQNLTIYVKNRDKNNQLFGILLHDERSVEYSTTITAESGKIVTHDNSALLYMKNGTVQKLNYQNKKSEILQFDDYLFNLSEGEEVTQKMHWKSKERYLNELINYEEDIPSYEIPKMRAELHRRFTQPFLPIIFAMLSLAFITRGTFSRRGNIFKIVQALSISITFLIISIAIYSMIESSSKFIPLIYLNFAVFFILGLTMLGEKTIAYKSQKS